jgi:hypothetical protein
VRVRDFLDAAESMPCDLRGFMAEAERLYWRTAMAGQPNMHELAKAAGIHRTVLYERLKRLGLRTPNDTYGTKRRNRGNAAWQALGNRVSCVNPCRAASS